MVRRAQGSIPEGLEPRGQGLAAGPFGADRDVSSSGGEAVPGGGRGRPTGSSGAGGRSSPGSSFGPATSASLALPLGASTSRIQTWRPAKTANRRNIGGRRPFGRRADASRDLEREAA